LTDNGTSLVGSELDEMHMIAPDWAPQHSAEQHLVENCDNQQKVLRTITRDVLGVNLLSLL
jgi:hypothetical protein